MENNRVSVLSDIACHLGEGAAWLPRAGLVTWFDIVEKKLLEHRPGTGRTIVHDLPVMGSVLAEIDADRQLLAADEGLFIRDAGTGALSLLTPLEADKPGNRSNDGRVHPSGALWIGTMGRKAESRAGSIYWFAGGRVVRLFANISIPNAICFSPDGATGYFVDTDVGDLMKVALNPSTGLPVGEPSVLRAHRGDSGLDGACVDADGLIWIAHWGGGKVEACTPAGDIARSVSIPASRATCPAFVGEGLDRMVITSAFQGMGEQQKAAEPDHGRTFIADVGARGLPWPPARPFAA